MSTWKKISFIAILLVAASIVVLKVKHDKQYPYGYRTCCLPCMMDTLRQYAADHTNWYPHAGQTALDSLGELNPKYTLSDASILAGISGDLKATRACIEQGRKLSDAESSWVYFAGFRTDDENVAIIWEREAGVTMNGERCDGHAVGFASGMYKQISSAQWDSFVRDQESVRLKILAGRKLHEE